MRGLAGIGISGMTEVMARADRKHKRRTGTPVACFAARQRPIDALRAFGEGRHALNGAKPMQETPMLMTQRDAGFFAESLASRDPEIFGAIRAELGRQRDEIELIASENIVSAAVLEAQGSVMTNKYAEGYPGRRYYGGCQFVDIAETLAIERAKQLFGCNFANVQPNSGSQMNQAVFLALLQPGDTFMGLDLNSGGHLTHGSPVNMSGKWFKVVSYGVRQQDERLDMAEIRERALAARPKLIVAGGTAYSRVWDWEAFRAIADEVGAWLMVDMAHIAGLVAGGQHPSPLPHAHVVTTTTHKSLRGPRGGMILCNDEAIAKKINSAVFPGLQGGPLMHVIAAKAVAFGEALRPEFNAYAAAVVANARAMADELMKGGINIVSGGTDNHLMLADLRPKGVKGNATEKALGRAHITCNKNGVPFDPEKPTVTSGIRLGTPAGTTRGFGEAEFREIARLIVEVVDGLAANDETGNGAVEAAVKAKVAALCARFPLYPNL
jgi:glycine hydroxymethyltransferase